MKLSQKLTVTMMSIAIVAAFASPATASAATDPLLPQQWALANPAATGAGEAWTQSSGKGVLVAVLDTGVQLDHPDLAGSIWTNPGEIAGNGRDDDANGFVDDVHGANMFDSSDNVDDDNGHGTHVAGIVAARKDNGIGGAGIAPGAQILPVKVLDASMAGTTDELARGIRYAVDRGAKILNVSINSDVATETVKAAVRYAGEHGAALVASSGNNGRNIDLLGSYIAAFPDAAIVSVAAMTEQGRLWNRANTGLLSVDLAAPGERIVSTTSGSSYQSRTGTSAAAPFVAGAMALLSAARPDLPMSALRATIIATTRRNDILASLIGGAQLDVGAAMHKVLGGAWRTAPPVDDAAAPQLTLGTKSGVRAGSRVPLRWAASGSDRVASWRVSLDRRVVATLPVSRARMTRVVKRAGRHRWRVVGFDDQRVKLVSAQRTFRVLRRR